MEGKLCSPEVSRDKWADTGAQEGWADLSLFTEHPLLQWLVRIPDRKVPLSVRSVGGQGLPLCHFLSKQTSPRLLWPLGKWVGEPSRARPVGARAKAWPKGHPGCAL